jgi:hypothetical protein
MTQNHILGLDPGFGGFKVAELNGQEARTVIYLPLRSHKQADYELAARRLRERDFCAQDVNDFAEYWRQTHPIGSNKPNAGYPHLVQVLEDLHGAMSWIEAWRERQVEAAAWQVEYGEWGSPLRERLLRWSMPQLSRCGSVSRASCSCGCTDAPSQAICSVPGPSIWPARCSPYSGYSHMSF